MIFWGQFKMRKSCKWNSQVTLVLGAFSAMQSQWALGRAEAGEAAGARMAALVADAIARQPDEEPTA